MDTVELDSSAALKAIEEIGKIDYHANSIEDIRQILNPLFKGYITVAPEFKKGLYVNRIRKCRKPENIREVSYPVADKAIPGRANEAGKPLFYTSVGKRVPFFELEPILGIPL